MAKRARKYIAELDADCSVKQDNYNQSFLESLEAAILLSLFHEGYLTKWQLETCLHKLQRRDGYAEGSRVLPGFY